MADYYDTYGTTDGLYSNNAAENTGSYATEGNYDSTDGLYSSGSQNPNSDDMLLEQIDAFREKAEQLQNMINERQSKVNKLENLDNTKIVRQLDEMNKSVNANLANIERKLDEQAGKPSEGGEISEESITQITTSVNGIKGEINSMKEELSEKVHSENVKVYRNINDLLTEMKESDGNNENAKEVLKKVRGAKAVAGWALFFGILDFLGIAGVAALMLRMIGLI